MADPENAAGRWPLGRLLQIGELLAAVAVVVSAAFIALEIRQNSRAQVLATTQSAVSDYIGSLELLSDDAGLACLYVRGAQDFDSLTGSERLRFSAFYMSTYYQLQEMHRFSLSGAIDADTWSGFDSLLRETTRYPGVRQWFEIRKSWFSQRFQTHVEGLIESAPPIAEYPFDEAADPSCGSPVEP